MCQIQGRINDHLTRAIGISFGGRKRKWVDLTNIIGKFQFEMRMHNLELQRIVYLITGEKEEEKDKSLVDELYGLPGLSSNNALEIFLMLFDDVQKTDCFLSLHMNKKYEYCMDLLGRRS